MKIVITNRDIEDPAETKQISPVAFDLRGEEDVPVSQSPPKAIATAALAASHAAPSRGRSVHNEIEEEVTELARKLAADKAGPGMSAAVTVRLYQKRPKGFGNFEQQVVQLLLMGNRFLSLSNVDLAKHMDARYEGFTVSPSLFYSPLKPWAKKKVHELLSQYGKRVDLTGKPTLSSIKKALKGDVARKKPNRSYSASLSFTDQELVVNGKVYPITVTKRGWRRIRVSEQQWISVENLEALLRKGSPPLLLSK